VTFTVGTTAPLLFINPTGVPAARPSGAVDWYFVPGDSVPLDYERTSQAWQIFSCWLQTTCTFTPPANLNGRMQVVAYVEGRLVIGRSDYVRAKPEQEPKLVLTCNTRSDSVVVERGGNIDCRAEATPAPGGPIKWKFVADGFPYTNPTEGSTAHTGGSWGGTMVVGGTITVSATIGSRPFEAQMQVRVRGRDWRGKEFEAIVVEDQPDADEFTARPPDVGELGHIHNTAQIAVVRGTWEPVLSGPNSLLGYFVKVPINYRGRVHVNRLALSVGSDFWSAQRETLPRNLRPGHAVPCIRSDVVPFIPVVQKHEGIGLDPKSHAYLWIEEGKKEFGPAAEPIVGTSADDLFERVQAVLDPAIEKANAASDLADSAGNRPTYCTFNYQYPRVTP
jgi:hypothetical protein